MAAAECDFTEDGGEQKRPAFVASSDGAVARLVVLLVMGVLKATVVFTLIGGIVGATAVWSIGLSTCCDLTDFMMIGD